MKKFLASVVLAVCLSVPAFAATLQYDFSRFLTGNMPSGTGPYATALFEDVATDTVRLTFTHAATNPSSYKISELNLTVNPAISSISHTLVTNSAFGSFDGFGYGQNSFNEPGGAKFDAKVSFKQANGKRLAPGHFVVLDLTGVGLDVTDFDFLTTSAFGPTPAMIHLQGLEDEGSAHLDPVPEPATMALAAPLALAWLRKRKKSA